ncbi:MAG TPA: rod-binding protein [Spirochaetales bacterium]|nr:rod-binding protein [Spirochaetales bacterium]HPB67131.1 rod-binding protein [Spirochaetales bacterium]HPM71480.1 rod-binding protein [Spirochaetales bacterium]
MTIDSATLAYQNRSLQVPRAPAQGLGARSASGGTMIDRSSKLYEQCQEFESIFVNMMLKEMRGTVEKSGLIDGGQAEEIFSDMLYDEYAKDMSKNAGFGLADAVYLELSRQSYRAG